MIRSVSRLNFTCGEEGCERPADYRVIRTNDELPDRYVQWGERALYFCADHMPNDALAFFRSAL